MQRRAPQKNSKHQASAELTPAEALMLRLEDIEPTALERMGAEEELRLGAKVPRWRMDDASPVGGVLRSEKRAANASAAWIMPAGSDGAAAKFLKSGQLFLGTQWLAMVCAMGTLSVLTMI